MQSLFRGGGVMRVVKIQGGGGLAGDHGVQSGVYVYVLHTRRARGKHLADCKEVSISNIFFIIELTVGCRFMNQRLYNK